MNEQLDEELRRRFSLQPVVAPDERFVAAVARQVARQRRVQRVLRVAGAGVLLLVAAVLAPWALTLGELANRGIEAIAEAGAGVPASLTGVVLVCALGFAAGALAWTVRRL